MDVSRLLQASTVHFLFHRLSINIHLVDVEVECLKIWVLSCSS